MLFPFADLFNGLLDELPVPPGTFCDLATIGSLVNRVCEDLDPGFRPVISIDLVAIPRGSP
jgi:hypothetical protein